MQDYKNYLDVYEEEYGNGFDEMTGVDEDYRLSNKEEKKTLWRIN